MFMLRSSKGSIEEGTGFCILYQTRLHMGVISEVYHLSTTFTALHLKNSKSEKG